MSHFYYPYRNNCRKRKNSWVDPSFSLQGAIRKTQGRVIEFAGPSPNGYYYINNVALPRNIEITNIRLDGGFFLEQHQLQSKKYISSILDIREDNLKPHTVGIALVSCLTIASEESFKNHSLDTVVNLVNDELDKLLSKVIIEPKLSLRAVFLYAAFSFLENGGIIVAEQFSKRDVMYAQLLGFKLCAYNGLDVAKDGETYQSLILLK